MVKQRSGGRGKEDNSPLPPLAPTPEIPLDTSAPEYKPEPTFLEAKDSVDILTPGSKSQWSNDDFPWSEQVNMPTGAGKSLLYQIPGVASRGLTLVVMPLISLIKDQIDFLASKCIRAKALIGPQSIVEQREVMQALEEDDAVQILITTPERLVSGPGLQTILKSRYDAGKLARLVIDEAHCISKWGTDFRADYLKLAEVTTQYPKLPVLCLTSTAPERVRDDILDRLNLTDLQALSRAVRDRVLHVEERVRRTRETPAAAIRHRGGRLPRLSHQQRTHGRAGRLAQRRPESGGRHHRIRPGNQ